MTSTFSYSVTVGLVVYNAAVTIESVVEAIRSQSIIPDEVIVIDDASTDSSIKKLKKLIQTDFPPTRVIVNSINRGIGFNRQKIVDMAKSPVVVFFDDDDYSLSDRVATHLSEISICLSYLRVEAPIMSLMARRLNGRSISPHHADWPRLCSSSSDFAGSYSVESSFNEIVWGKKGPLENGHTAACAMALYLPASAEGKKLFEVGLRRSEDTGCAAMFSSFGGYIIGSNKLGVIQAVTQGAEKTFNYELRNHFKLIRIFKLRNLIYAPQDQWLREVALLRLTFQRYGYLPTVWLCFRICFIKGRYGLVHFLVNKVKR